MSLKGSNVVAKLFQQMQDAEEILSVYAASNPSSVASKQDEKLRSIVKRTLGKMMEEIEPVITGDYPPAVSQG